ncbi:Aldehyde/histidinol dehydrogenase [Tricladium varicosporioides]|nr:Aldehyde/histidinol dehydrogenase [Hymenoscyphus varicosporioides]
MTTIFRRLLTVLNISFYFPNIHTTFDSKEDFMKRSVAQADVTIFTGKEKNARHIAVAKTIEAKLFNSGQDCAGPDTILIHRDIAHQFVGMLKDQLRCVKVGDYTDPDVTVGKIAEEGRLSHLSTFLLKNQPDIVYGGCVDYQKGIVHPTVIVSSLAKKKNYEEFFSPIFFVSIFDDDQQLAAYFGSPQYSANEILGASFVASQGRVVAKPILVPREISEFLASKAIIQSARYRKWIGEYHQKMDMVVDEMFPAEIVTLKFLEEAIASLETIVLNLEHTDIRVFDIVLLTVALSGCKRGIVGNQELLFEYAKKVGKYPKLWKHQILYELEKSLKFAGPIAKERQEKSTEQLKKILQMDPALVLKRFIGLEHLSAEQRHSAHGLIHWDNDRHSIQFDSHALR